MKLGLIKVCLSWPSMEESLFRETCTNRGMGRQNGCIESPLSKPRAHLVGGRGREETQTEK